MALVSETSKSLTLIEETMATIDSAVASIASDARSQAAGLAEVNVAVTQMDQMTQQNASMAEEATAASQSLATEGDELARLIGEFAISNGVEDDLRQKLKAPAPHAFAKKAKPALAAAPRPVKRAAAGLLKEAVAENDDWHEF